LAVTVKKVAGLLSERSWGIWQRLAVAGIRLAEDCFFGLTGVRVYLQKSYRFNVCVLGKVYPLPYFFKYSTLDKFITSFTVSFHRPILTSPIPLQPQVPDVFLWLFFQPEDPSHSQP
jgi:hypothetical protein